MLAAHFTPVAFADLPGWESDDPTPAYTAFRRCARHARQKPYRSGALGVDFDSFLPAYEDALQDDRLNPGEARRFFQDNFIACRIADPESATGFVTGFYEPEVRASSQRTERFRTPLLARPDDLVKLKGESSEGLDPAFEYGRRTPGGLVEYPDRRTIETGALAGRGLEIAWLEDPVDAFFIHVQGAARLLLENDETIRITFAAKSGHPFTGPGRILAGLGEIAAENVTMQSIRDWFRHNPERINEILWQNRSYIFFAAVENDDPLAGPVAAAKVPLTAGRSLAVDRKLHTFGTPFYIDAATLTAFDGHPFRRLMIAQDTGSAIVGPARGDLFAGSGAAAGEIAGVVRHQADFYALVPKQLVVGNRP